MEAVTGHTSARQKKRGRVFSTKRSMVSLLTCGALFAATSARADLEIVTEVTTTTESGASSSGPNNNTGSSTAPLTSAKQTFTAYFKGRKARLETLDAAGGRTVTLFDREADKVYTLDPDRKTYFVRSFKETFQAASAVPDTLSRRFSLDTSLQLDQVKDGSSNAGNRTLAGKDTLPYTLSGYASLKPKEEPNAGRSGMGGGMGGGFPGGGRRRGGGGFPGGGFPGGGQAPGRGTGGGNRRQSASMPRLNVVGNIWGVDATALLPTGKEDEKEMSLAVVQQILPPGSPLLDETAKSLSRMKLLPLLADLTFQTPPDMGNSSGGVASLSGTAAVSSVAVHMEVKSIQQGAALNDNLFALPTDYRLVTPPVTVSPFTPRR